jgi:hypothetical protein
VKRSTHKPLGRYEQWSDDHITHQRDVIQFNTVPPNQIDILSSVSLKSDCLYVVDMIGKQYGHLYCNVEHTPNTVRTFLTEADCIADIVNVNYDPKTKKFELSVIPHHRTPSTDTLKKRDTQSRAPLPQVGTWMTLFMEDTTSVAGKVVYMDSSSHVEVITADGQHIKSWLKIPITCIQTPKTADDINIVQYWLTRLQQQSLSTSWVLSSEKLNKPLNRIQFVHQGSHATRREKMSHLLAQLAPQSISHIVPVFVCAEEVAIQPDTDTKTPKQLIDVQVTLDDDSTDEATLQTLHSNTTVQQPNITSYPFSIIKQLEAVHTRDVSPQSKSKRSFTAVWVGLQSAEDTYVSFLNTRDTVIDRPNSGNYTLFPTTQQLHLAQQYSVQPTPTANDVVCVTLTSPDTSHLANCLRFCEEAQQRKLRRSVVYPNLRHTLQFVGVSRTNFYEKPTPRVQVQVQRADVDEFSRRLAGQVVVDIQNDVSRKLDVDGFATRMDTYNHHIGQMCQLFHYHNVDDSAILALPRHIHALVLSGDDKSLLPLPLRHTAKYKRDHHMMTNDTDQVAMVLNTDRYHPHHLYPPSEMNTTYETFHHSLPVVKHTTRISHIILAKKLSSSRALYDISQSFVPTWFNVEEDTRKYDSITQLRQHFCTKHSSTFSHLLSRASVVHCDADAHTHALYYMKVPTDDLCTVAPYHTALSPSKPHTTMSLTGNSNDPSEYHHKNVSFSNEFFGHSLKGSASTSHLSHVLYGSLDNYYNSVDVPYQKKNARTQLVVTDYGPNDLHMYGAIATPRFRTSPIVFKHTDHFNCVFRIEQQDIPLISKHSQQLLSHVRFPITVASFCRLVDRLLREIRTRDNSTTPPQIQIKYCSFRNSVLIQSPTAFQIIEPAGLVLLGAIPHSPAIWNEATKHHEILLHQCSRFMLVSPSDSAVLATPQYKVQFKYTCTTTSNIEPQPILSFQPQFRIYNSTDSNEPVDSASKHKLNTLVGRDGYTQYTSSSLHHIVIGVGEDVAIVPSGAIYKSTHEPHNTTYYPYPSLSPEHHHGTYCCQVYSISGVSYAFVEKKEHGDTPPHTLGHYTLAVETGKADWTSSSWPPWMQTLLATASNSPLHSSCIDNTSSTVVFCSASIARHPTGGQWVVTVVCHTGDVVKTNRILQMDANDVWQPIIIHLRLQLQQKGNTNTLVCNVLDANGVLHSYAWKPSSGVLQPGGWDSTATHRATQFYTQQRHQLQEASSMCVNDESMQIGCTNGIVHTFALKQTSFRPHHSWSVSNRLLSVPFAWKWKRNALHPQRSVVVEICHSGPIDGVTMEQWESSSIAHRVRTALEPWFGYCSVDTLTVAYYNTEHYLHSDIDLCRYLLNNVVGRRSMHSRTFARKLQQDVVCDPMRVRVQAQAVVQQYVGGNTVVHTLPSSAVSEYNRLLSRCHSLTLHHLSLLSTPESKSAPRPTRNSRASSVVSKRELFYFKMKRLMQSSAGIQYVRNLYSTSAIFRHQFVKCRGYCYYKLLHRLKHLVVSNKYAVRTRWTDRVCDKYTTVMDGDVYHTCIRCGEAVCKQEDGLRTEFGAIGQSTTHQETNDPDNETTPHVPITKATQEQQLLLSALHEHIDRVQLSTYQRFIFDLPVTRSVQKYTKIESKSLYLLLLDKTLSPSKWRKLLELACEAVQQKLRRLRQHTQTVQFQHKPWETQIIAEWLPAIHLTTRDSQRGIAPRRDFRPQLYSQPSTHTHPNWKRLHTELNNTSKIWNNVFDWTSKQNTNSLYEYNDKYACANKSIVQTTAYTTLPKLVNCELRADDEIPSHPCVHRHTLTMWCPSNRHSGLHRDESLPIPRTTSVFVKKDAPPCLNVSLAREVTDVQRRLVVHKHTQAFTPSTNVYPHAIQVMLQHNMITENNVVEQLHCLLGISIRQKLRLTTNPSMLLNAEWVKYYQQLDTSLSNEHIVHQLKQVKKNIMPELFKDPQNLVYDKFIT